MKNTGEIMSGNGKMKIEGIKKVAIPCKILDNEKKNFDTKKTLLKIKEEFIEFEEMKEKYSVDNIDDKGIVDFKQEVEIDIKEEICEFDMALTNESDILCKETEITIVKEEICNLDSLTSSQDFIFDEHYPQKKTDLSYRKETNKSEALNTNDKPANNMRLENISEKNNKNFIHSVKEDFTQNGAFNKHLLTNSEKKFFFCNICNKSFSLKSHVKRHMLVHSGKKDFSCNICEKSFSLNSSLKIHMLVHSGKKNFSCNICNKLFSLKSYLKLHMIVHSGKKEFSCNICNKSFSRKSNLKLHMLVHSGKKEFSCNICNKSFSCNSNLKIHMLVHSGKKEFSCDICNKSFSRKCNLKRHILVHS